MRKGLAVLALGHPRWPVRLTARMWPKGWALSTFGGGWPHCFGDPRAHIVKMWDLGAEFDEVLFDAWWSDGHFLVPLKELSQECRKFENFARNHPSKRIFLSPSCEYKFMAPNQIASPVEVKKRLAIVKEFAPSCIPVFTPMDAPVPAQVMVAQHGYKAVARAGQIFSMDGSDPREITIERWRTTLRTNQHCEIGFNWLPIFNMFGEWEREYAEKNGHKPPCEIRQSIPTAEDFATAINLLNEAP